MAAFEELNVADKKKEMIAMPRHSFIQMTKLHNVMGRIDYITSTVKQENLYAIYATQPLRSFWKDLAKCNREEFAKSGTIGKYIEARELIIALPEGLYHMSMIILSNILLRISRKSMVWTAMQPCIITKERQTFIFI